MEQMRYDGGSLPPTGVMQEVTPTRRRHLATMGDEAKCPGERS